LADREPTHQESVDILNNFHGKSIPFSPTSLVPSIPNDLKCHDKTQHLEGSDTIKMQHVKVP
jgi:hypothetical protein